MFGSRRLVIDRTGSPVAAPVTPGSRPSRAAIESEDPGVVEIDAEGRLVGVRAGRTFVRSRSGGESRLEVIVQPAQSIRIEPSRLTMKPGATAVLTVVNAETGEALDHSVATWTVTPPDAASVWRGEVRAGPKNRNAIVSARYGGLEATGEVVIHAIAERPVSVSPAAARLRVGQVIGFQAFDSRGAIAAPGWMSTNARVLRAMQGGLFAASHPGKARVCAGAGDSEGCATVEVQP